MASLSSKDLGLRRLTNIGLINEVSQGVLIYLLVIFSPDKGLSESFYDYYLRKGISKGALSCFDKKQQLPKLQNDRDGKTFDVSLVWKCFRHGMHGLSKDGNDWKEGDTTIESCISWVKNRRNEIFHDLSQDSNEQMCAKANALRYHLIKLLRFAESLNNVNKADIDAKTHEVEMDIARYVCGGLVPLTYEQLKKLPLFRQICNYVDEKAVKEELLHCETDSIYIDTPNHIFGVQLPLVDIFTEMMLEEDLQTGVKRKTSYEEILQDENKEESDSVIVIYGHAGTGKTTLTKKLSRDWREKKSTMKYLTTYKHLFKAECREMSVETVNNLLLKVLQEVEKDFSQLDHLRFAIYEGKALFVIDGADEINASSKNLLEDILRAKKDHGIGVVVTTRPEKMGYLKSLMKSLGLSSVKYIELVGIPKDKREELVCRYHDAIAYKYQLSKDKGGLIKFLRETELRLSEIWKSPYNLTLITILWVSDNTCVIRISTEAELHHEIFILCKTKLKERLQINELTALLEDSELDWKIETLIYSISKESIIGLKNDQICLPSEAYERLRKSCEYKKVPVEEILSAFMRRRVMGFQIMYAYPHKGVQEHFAASYIWLKMTAKFDDSKAPYVIRNIDSVLHQSAVPTAVSQSIQFCIEEKLTKKQPLMTSNISQIKTQVDCILKANNVPKEICALGELFLKSLEDAVSEPTSVSAPPEESTSSSSPDTSSIHCSSLSNNVFPIGNLPSSDAQESSVIRSIMEEVLGDPVSDLSKFQNMLMQLTGMFCTGGIPIENSIKMEAIELLKESGIEHRDDWLKILSNMKCDEYVAEVISKQSGILEDPIITDSNIFSYNVLMHSMKPSRERLHPVCVYMRVEGHMSDIGESLMAAISKHDFEVRTIVVTDLNVGFYRFLFQNSKIPKPSIGKIQLKLELTTRESIEALAFVVKQHYKEVVDVRDLNLEHLFRGTSVPDESAKSDDVISEILNRCKVKFYKGAMTTKFNLPETLVDLRVRIPDGENFKAVHRLLFQRPPGNLGVLVLCFGIDFDAVDVLKPLSWEGFFHVFVSDVSNQDVVKAADILKRLQPVEGRKMFFSIYLPRASLNPDGRRTFILALGERGVRCSFLHLSPKDVVPEDDEKEVLRELAERTLGTKELSWEDEEKIWMYKKFRW